MIPRATYRLQFNRDFTFTDAAALAPYLADLGISHVYASPWLKARAGSTHGYDIIDHAAFNPEIGGGAGFERLHAALTAHGLGQILDFVPNHMGVGEADNTWWLDVLRWGRASPYADWFDIDWAPANSDLRNKVLLPFLGDHYGAVIERGELELRFDPEAGSFSVWYFDQAFPLAPHTWAVPIRAAAKLDPAEAPALEILAQAAEQLRVRAGSSPRRAARIRSECDTFSARLASGTSLHAVLARGAASLAAKPEEPASIMPLHGLLERQAYRLAYWQVAADEINYRRFFDINGLAALRVENPQVFARIHALVQRLLDAGKLDGLRIDHVDGLFDPAQYCRRLRRMTPKPFYLVVEKILARHESLPPGWPVDGTTGYDFLNEVAGLFVDARSEGVLTRGYDRFIGKHADFDAVLHAAKMQIMQTKLSSELHLLAHQLHRLARRHPRTRDYTRAGLTRALAAVIAAFPVYRTYVDRRGADASDQNHIAWAVAQARKTEAPSADIFDFVEQALTTDLAAIPGYRRSGVLRFAMKFQQYTSPVMAKGFEDTALYRYHRLACLNDVGGDPRRFGLSVSGFHRACQARARQWPQAMLATATHDTKRGEDMRARLCALTTLAETWTLEVRHWARLNRIWKTSVDDQPAPDRNDEYLLYQTLIGAWPNELTGHGWDDAGAAAFAERVQAYMVKALREAKLHSSWARPNEAYEEACKHFVSRILDRESGRLFLEAFLPLQREVAEQGMRNSLGQLVLKLTVPGVPDIYQGCESWDYSLVDPDNRRPVDFAERARLLARVKAWEDLPPARRLSQLAAWRDHWHDGAIKLHVTRRLLRLRAANEPLFSAAEYQPLEFGSENGAIAFERTTGSRRLVVAVLLRRDDAATTSSRLRNILGASDKPFEDVLAGRQLLAAERAGRDSLFELLPAAVLLQ